LNGEDTPEDLGFMPSLTRYISFCTYAITRMQTTASRVATYIIVLHVQFQGRD
jgi:hypothetical protein